jgi:peptide chain release factor subunit 1
MRLSILLYHQQPTPLTVTLTQPQTGVELELQNAQSLKEWLATNYKTFGTSLEIITDRSQEGAQFCKGFGGIGGE